MVYEDDIVAAFRDANPVAPIHVLIVPRKHVPTLNDIPDGDPILSHVGQVARKVARQFGVEKSGYRLLMNVNREGGQVVFHLHCHFIAGRDLGQDFIRVAAALSVLWRKLVRFL